MNTAKLSLTTKITRNEKTLQSVDVREPVAGDMRGLKLFDVMQADINALATLLPRITTPTLTSEEVMTFTLHDCANVAVAIADFTDPSTSSPSA